MPPKKACIGDRFIPIRHELKNDRNLVYLNELTHPLLVPLKVSTPLLTFKPRDPLAPEFQTHITEIQTRYDKNQHQHPLSSSSSRRSIDSIPYLILDLPGLKDDFYCNVLDWSSSSSSSSSLAVALASRVYLFDPISSDHTVLVDLEKEEKTSTPPTLTSLSWCPSNPIHLAMGTSLGVVRIYDTDTKEELVHSFSHTRDVLSLAWNPHDPNMLVSGGRNGWLVIYDTRMYFPQVHCYKAHIGQICGLKWSPDGTNLASGGNDNVCRIWDHRYMSNNSYNYHTMLEDDSSQRVQPCCVPLYALSQHKAAVKALAWHPYQRGLLATGSGTADGHIRFFDLLDSGRLLQECDTKSQISSLNWSHDGKELLSAHGFPAHRHLSLWKYPSKMITPIAQLSKDSGRILHVAMSPDGTSVCSASQNETLCFWRIWGSSTNAKHESIICKNNKRKLILPHDNNNHHHNPLADDHTIHSIVR